MAESKPINDWMTTNTLRTYNTLDDAMMEALFDGRREYAESTAHTLLENDDLPLFIRCRANIVLGCSDKPGFLGYAEEALRIARLGHDGKDNPSELAKFLLDDCQKVYDEAKQADAAGVGRRRRNSDDVGEVVWHYQKGYIKEAASSERTEEQPPEGSATSQAGPSKDKQTTDEDKLITPAPSSPPGRRRIAAGGREDDVVMGEATGGGIVEEVEGEGEQLTSDDAMQSSER